MQTEKFIRKVRAVNAVQVTEANMEEVAKWCGGLVVPINGLGQKNPKPYVHVAVRNARNEADSQAAAGTWVIQEGFNNYRIVTDKQFKNSYTSANDKQPARTGVPSPKSMPTRKQSEAAQQLAAVQQVGAVQVVPGTPAPNDRSGLTTGRASIENTVEAAAAAGIISAEDAAQERSELSEIRDEEAHNAVAAEIATGDDMVALGVPLVDVLCDECGSPVINGVCTVGANHIVNSSAQL